MPAHIHIALSAEALAEELWQHLFRPDDSADPFVSPVIVVPNRNADVWLRRHWAKEHGIAMNLDLPYLEKGIRESFAGDRLAAGKDEVQLAIMAELLRASGDEPDSAAGVACRSILDWTRIDGGREGEPCPAEYSEARMWDISASLAEHFDNYMLHRNGDATFAGVLAADGFQGRLDTVIGQQIAAGRKLFLRDLLGDAVPVSPKRKQQLALRGLHLFAFASVSPLHLAVINRLCRESGADLHVWHLSPLAIADVTGLRVREVPGATTGMWTRASRSMLRLVADAADTVTIRQLSPATSSPFAKFLQGADSGMSGLSSSGTDSAAHDDVSPGRFPPWLRVVGAPTLQAEIEYVYNSILWHLARDSSLALDDIVVFAADIAAYRPVIAAVFAGGLGPDDRRCALEFSIAGESLADGSVWAAGLLALFGLATVEAGRFDRATLHPVLGNAAVLAAACAVHEDVEDWFRSAAELGVFSGPAVPPADGSLPADRSWAKGLARLRLARVMESDGRTDWQGLVPAATRPDSSGILSRLLEEIHSVIAPLVSVRMPGAGWVDVVRGIADRFLAVPPERMVVERAVPRLVLGALDGLASLPVCGIETVRAFLCDVIGGLPLPGAGSGGRGIVVTGMQQVRPVPYRLVYVVGFAEGIFPRPWQPEDPLDLRKRNIDLWPGDIDESDRERMLFVETLLSVRQMLSISWKNRDVIADRPLYPSSLVGELLGLLGWNNSDPAAIQLPLSGWSAVDASLLAEYPDVFANHLAQDRAVAEATADDVPRADRDTNCSGAVSPDKTKRLGIMDIERVFKDPADGLLYARYKVRDLVAKDVPLESDEPFLFEDTGLDLAYGLVAPLALAWLVSSDEKPAEAWLDDEGWRWFRHHFVLADRMPPAFFGQLTWDEIRGAVLDKMKALATVRERVAAARAAGTLRAPLVFGKAPHWNDRETVGGLLPEVVWDQGLVLDGEIPLAWTETVAGEDVLCLFADRESPCCQKKSGVNWKYGKLASIAQYFVCALPRVRRGLGYGHVARVRLVFSTGIDVDIAPAAEHEAMVDRAIHLLVADGATPELLPADMLYDLALQDRLGHDVLLLELQNATTARHGRRELKHVLQCIGAEIPDDARIGDWYATMLEPWIRLVNPEYFVPEAERETDDAK